MMNMSADPPIYSVDGWREGDEYEYSSGKNQKRAEWNVQLDLFH